MTQDGIPRRFYASNPVDASIALEAMKEPFRHISECGGPGMICQSIPGKPKGDHGDFPNNIAEWLFYYEGCDYEESWMALVKLTNGNYAFYSAYADSVGFDRRDMTLYVDPDPQVLVEFAMEEDSYRKYVKAMESDK
jgi:hypothetical protein